MPEVERPMVAAQNSLNMVQPGFASNRGAGPVRTEGYLKPENVNEIYGILAANASNPEAVGQNYVSAMQRQQNADTYNQPLERFLRMYGNVNPYDFTQDSLADFHDTLMNTNDMAQAFRKLKRVETMSSNEQKFLHEAIETYQEAERSTSQMMSLAQRFEQANQAGIRTGALGGLEEWFLKFAGNENDWTLMRAEYDRLRNAQVIQALPKGPASDKDIAIAQRGFPDSTANAAYVAAFLRGMAKMKAVSQAQAMHRAHYIGRNKTEQGLLTDWASDRDYWINKAVDSVGGWYAPVKADGTPMTSDEALEARFGNTTTLGGAPTGEVPPVATPAGDVSAEPTPEQVMEKYRRLNRAKARGNDACSKTPTK